MSDLQKLIHDTIVVDHTLGVAGTSAAMRGVLKRFEDKSFDWVVDNSLAPVDAWIIAAMASYDFSQSLPPEIHEKVQGLRNDINVLYNAIKEPRTVTLYKSFTRNALI